MTTSPDVTPTNKARHAAVPGLSRDAQAPAMTPKLSPDPPVAMAEKFNSPLAVLRLVGWLLFLGGLIAMITGATRTLPRTNFKDSTAMEILQFASTSTLIALIGGVVLLLGGMSLVGSLVVTAVKASR